MCTHSATYGAYAHHMTITLKTLNQHNQEMPPDPFLFWVGSGHETTPCAACIWSRVYGKLNPHQLHLHCSVLLWRMQVNPSLQCLAWGLVNPPFFVSSQQLQVFMTLKRPYYKYSWLYTCQHILWTSECSWKWFIPSTPDFQRQQCHRQSISRI